MNSGAVLTGNRGVLSWESFGHEQASYRSYNSGEDGLFGWSDDQAQLCLSLALWNGKDSILKERLYGMTGPQVRLARHLLFIQ